MTGAAAIDDRPLAPRCDAAALRDPYPFYGSVRAQAGLGWSADLGGWLVARHDDIRAGLADPRLSAERLELLLSQRFAAGTEAHAAASALNRHSMFFLDGPRQAQARRCVGSALRAGNVGALAEAMAGPARALAAGLVARGGGDLLAEYALPLSIALMGEMFDLDERRRRDLRFAIESLVDLFGGGGAPSDPQAAIRNLRLMRTFVEDLAMQPAARGASVFDRALALAREQGLDDEQLIGIGLDLAAGGFVPFTNLVGNTLACLLQHVDWLATARRSPAMIARAVEEAGRFEPPNQITSRVAAQGLDLADTRIEQGDLVFFLLASGNRDAALCPDADRYDPGRRPVRTFTFGGGAHACVGAPLAVGAAAVAIRELLAATAVLEAACPPRWRARTLRVRGLESLPVRCA